jgi:hypothetical protein
MNDFLASLALAAAAGLPLAAWAADSQRIEQVAERAPATAALPLPVGWKLIPVARPSGAGGLIDIPASVIGSRRSMPT